MNPNSKRARTTLTSTILVLMFVLASCAPAKSNPTNTPVPTGLFSSVLPTATIAPTEAKVVLQGATTTASGLQYLQIQAGTGPAPEKGDIIEMNFNATLANGTELVNTNTQGKPATVVWGHKLLWPGWEEAVGMMKEGGSAKIVIPPDLALGAKGNGSSIPPNAQIIMEIDLLSVKHPPVPQSIDASKFTTTPTGLQYYDISVGSGTEAITSTIVTTSYTLWVKGVISGTVTTPDNYIASSDYGGTPMMFTLGRGDTVFPGWEQGTAGMKVGGIRQLIIPPALGLGGQSAGEIPANATLIMEISLTDVHQPQVMTKVNESDYKTTASGLKYYDIKVGDGPSPLSGQTVTIHYTGWLQDGTQFDSSRDRNQPFSFAVGQNSVIPGLEEGVLSMKVGGIRQIVIPPNLAYGSTGSGNTIPPNATLVFEIELLAIK